jgi:hypothetical protein
MADDENTILSVVGGEAADERVDLASRHDSTFDREGLRGWFRGLDRPSSLAGVDDADTRISQNAG